MSKIGFDQIIDSENIRQEYADIEELADSIQKRGQLEPVIVKKAKGGYELIAGFRRLRAMRLLHKRGDGKPEIEATITTGDRLTIQLIENLQRSDLTAREREEGIYLMTKNGFTQKEVAAELSKKSDYISRHITAYKIRKKAEERNIDTSDLETFTLGEIAAAKDEDIPMLLGYIKNGGGTKAAARKIMEAYRGNKKTDPAPAAEIPAETIIKAPSDLSVSGIEDVARITGVDLSEIDTLTEADTEPKPPAPSIPSPSGKRDPERPKEPDHRVIDIQYIFDKIYGYMDALEKKIKESGGDEAVMASYKKEAALDIVALIHEGL